MGFSVLAPIQTTHRRSIGLSADPALSPACVTGRIASKSSSPNRLEQTKLHMSSTEKVQTTKKGTKVMDRIETKSEEKKNKEEMWRVVLDNDEVHTFNYVVRSLCKVIGTLDRKAAFEICVQTHGIGKATVTKTYKKQSEAHCLGLQRRKFYRI
jgi:ATP-dependent Clp protease adapter protein ClpS